MPLSSPAVTNWAMAHVRLLFILLLIQSAIQLIPAIFTVLWSPMVVMFSDHLGKSESPVTERIMFLSFAIVSAVVLLATASFLLTSILGIYAGALALKGSVGAIHAQVL
jgi:hypothetical protein